MKNFNWKDLLVHHSLFEGLNPKEVERIIGQLLDDKVSDEREYSEGKVVVREGELGDSVFLVGRGSVQVVLEGDNGSGTPISTLRQGEFFGEMALIEKKPRAATVKAKESCILLEIKGQEFLKLLDEHKDVESKMLLKLSERLRHANDQILAVRMRGVDEKLEALKVKHEAELKAVDAQLQAALAVFDQTKLRTDEIINSAERSRAQRTWFFGIVATLVSLGAGFGLKEVFDLKAYSDRAQLAIETIDQVTTKLEEIKPSINNFERASKSLNDIIFSTEQYKFKDALLKGTEDDIDSNYTRLRELHGNYKWFLNDIELAMLTQPKRNYVKILEAILNDSQDPEERVRAYYLLLTSEILTDRRENFEKQIQDFKRYIDTRGPFKPFDLSALKALFQKERPDRLKLFNRVARLLPEKKANSP